MIAAAIYFLCALLSCGCAIMLLRSYFRHSNKLIFWATVCFIGMAINNLILVVDILVFPEVDLSMLRAVTFLLAVGSLSFGLTYDEF